MKTIKKKFQVKSQIAKYNSEVLISLLTNSMMKSLREILCVMMIDLRDNCPPADEKYDEIILGINPKQAIHY